MDDPKAAIVCVTQAIGLAEEWGEPYRLLAEIAANDLGDYQIAVNALLLMIEKTGGFTAGDMFNLSAYATDAEDHELAAGAYAKGINTLIDNGYKVEHSRWYELGCARCRNEDFRTAVQAFEKAVKGCKDESQLGDYHLWLAYAQRRSGDISGAIHNIIFASKYGIDDHETDYQLGLCFLADGQEDRARELFRQCINADPKGPRAAAARERLW